MVVSEKMFLQHQLTFRLTYNPHNIEIHVPEDKAVKYTYMRCCFKSVKYSVQAVSRSEVRLT